MSIIDKLNEILAELGYGFSDLDSAINELPDYRANETSKDYLSGVESYIVSAKDDLEDVIVELEELSNELG